MNWYNALLRLFISHKDKLLSEGELAACLSTLLDDKAPKYRQHTTTIDRVVCPNRLGYNPIFLSPQKHGESRSTHRKRYWRRSKAGSPV
jgi:hypothetical protein